MFNMSVITHNPLCMNPINIIITLYWKYCVVLKRNQFQNKLNTFIYSFLHTNKRIATRI